MEIFKLFGSIFVNTDAAEQSISSTGKKAEGLTAVFGKVGESLKSAGSKISDFGGKISGMGKKFAPVSAAVTGIGIAGIKTAADFESSMSQVAATMGMTSEEINNGSEDYKRLEQAARDMGKATMFSASEAAEALNYLALAGYDVDKSIDTLPTVLNLAAAGGIDLAYASDMVTDAMSALGDTAGTAEEFVDKMAKTSQKSNTSVAQLGEAILTVGGTAKNLAGGTTELNTALGILADNGIKGAEGGTALRNIILSLSAPTDKAADAMNALGLEVYDAEGKMRPLNEVFKDLDSILGTMSQGEQTEVLNTIFNKVDLKSANALLANCGDRFDELSGYINESEGAAQAMADTMQNNLNGQITQLKSAISEAGISIGNLFIPTIKKLVSVVQSWTDKFNSLDEGHKKIIAAVGAVIAAIGPLLLIVGKVITVVGSVVSGLGGASSALALMTNPIGIAVAAIGTLVAALVHLFQTNENFRRSVINTFSIVKETVLNLVESIVSNVSPAIQSIGSTFRELQQAVSEVIDGTIVPLIQAFIDMIGELLAENQDKITAIGKLFGAVFEIIGNVFSFFYNVHIKGILFPAIKFILSIVSSNMDKIKAVFQSVFDLIGGIIEFFTALFKGDWEGMWESIKSIAEAGKDFIVNIFSLFVGIIATALSPVIDKISEIFEGIKTAITSKIEEAKEILVGIFTSISEKVSAVFETVKNIVSVGLQLIGNIISFATDIIMIPWNFIWENFGDTITSVLNAIYSYVSDKINAVANVISAIFNAVLSMVSNIWNAIYTFISSIWNAIYGYISEKITAVLNCITTIFTSIKDFISNILTAVLSKVKEIFESIRLAIVNKINQAKDSVTTVFTKIKETISEKLEAAKKIVSDIFDSIKKAITDKIEAAKKAVTDTIDKIKEAFNFEWKLPDLKLPHIKIEGEWSFNPPKVPTFGIEWYKDGGIMTEPTMFGFNPATGKAMVGGEAGPEAVAPIETLQKYVEEAVDNRNEALIEVLTQILKAIVGLDDSMESKLYTAMSGLRLQMNEREFARLVKGV